jgi:uncharacterized integral membrane protein
MRWIKTFLWMAAFFFAIHFSIQNREELVLRYSIRNYLVFEVSGVPLFVVILCSVFVGVFIGGVWDLYRRVQLKKSLRQNQKTIEKLEREIESARGFGSDQPSFLK